MHVQAPRDLGPPGVPFSYVVKYAKYNWGTLIKKLTVELRCIFIQRLGGHWIRSLLHVLDLGGRKVLGFGRLVYLIVAFRFRRFKCAARCFLDF